jgi:hypothetical protein
LFDAQPFDGGHARELKSRQTALANRLQGSKRTNMAQPAAAQPAGIPPRQLSNGGGHWAEAHEDIEEEAPPLAVEQDPSGRYTRVGANAEGCGTMLDVGFLLLICPLVLLCWLPV